MFHALPPPFDSVVPFVIVLGVLVFFHELGHYVVARWVGVHVETFSIGFGRAMFTWKDRVGTVWKLGWIPLGGYVKLHGQERPQDVPDEVRAAWLPGRTFHEKRVAARAAVVAAGPVANFLLAAVLFPILFLAMGEPVAIPHPPPLIEQVIVPSAAARAGLQAGDVIMAINGEPTGSFEDIRRIVSAHPDETLTLRIRRGTAEQTVSVTTDSRSSGGTKIGSLGVSAQVVEYHKLPVAAAVVLGIRHTWDVAVQTLAGVWAMITAGTGTADLGGPLRIAQLSGEMANLGIMSLVNFIAVLSINLGLVNLFPIPILDGGHLVFFAAEAVRGRPLPQRAVEFGFRAGLALLVGLFVFATWNDLTHLGLVRWVQGQIGG